MSQDPLPASTTDLEGLPADVRAEAASILGYLAHSQAPNTRRHYASDWHLFERFCAAQGAYSDETGHPIQRKVATQSKATWPLR